jgi:hypothetical protein
MRTRRSTPRPTKGVSVARNKNKNYIDLDLTDEDSVYWEEMSSPSEQFFGEFHSASHGKQRQEEGRRLQDLGDLCVGKFIGIQYSLEIRYRLTNPDITLDEIINEPFSTREYREIYMNDWLKANDPIGVFDCVRCTGQPRIVVPGAPSPAPSGSSTKPVSPNNPPKPQQ